MAGIATAAAVSGIVGGLSGIAGGIIGSGARKREQAASSARWVQDGCKMHETLA